jgi:hypothetical protein
MSGILEVWIESCISKEDMFLWMSRGNMEGEPESTIITAQN